MHRLHTYCTDNKLAVNVGKTKTVKFRRGGPLRKSDIMYYEGKTIEFVPNFTYLGVIMNFIESRSQEQSIVYNK